MGLFQATYLRHIVTMHPGGGHTLTYSAHGHNAAMALYLVEDSTGVGQSFSILIADSLCSSTQHLIQFLLHSLCGQLSEGLGKMPVAQPPPHHPAPRTSYSVSYLETAAKVPRPRSYLRPTTSCFTGERICLSVRFTPIWRGYEKGKDLVARLTSLGTTVFV